MIAQLDTKTVYSFMDSLVSIKKYVEKAKEFGYSHLGIMDMDNLYGAYHFLEETKAAGIQGLLGLDLNLVKDGQPLSLRLLAINSQGYRNLMKVSTLIMLDKKEWSDIQHLMQGLALIVPAYPGIDDLDLGKDYYIGVSPTTPLQEFSRPTLPLYTVRYFDTGDLETLQMLRAIRENVSLREVGDLPSGQHLLRPEQLRQIFEQTFPESLENLEGLVRDIHYDIDTELKLPRFNPERPAVEELQERSEAGLKKRGLTSSLYQERLEQELNVIHQMGFDDYFLIVWDLLRFGRSQGYYMGMGRGSAVGSLVAYALEITGIWSTEVANQVVANRVVGDVAGKTAVLLDDMIDTGGTIAGGTGCV